jgi:hypothetical protein
MSQPTWPVNIPDSKRGTKNISSGLDKKLLAYANAAAAAGVGVLALSQSAAAEIKFTRVNETLGPITYLDVNGDGINDFRFITTRTSHCEGVCTTYTSRRFHHKTAFGSDNAKLAVYGSVSGNQAFGGPSYAAALRAGKRVGPHGRFPAGNKILRLHGISEDPSTAYGPWAGADSKGVTAYLGFKFLISGETHYGWARIAITITPGANFQATLTGYAYDTIPNHYVETGRKSGTDAASNAAVPPKLAPQRRPDQVAGLGCLALGVVGLSAWRREEELVQE